MLKFRMKMSYSLLKDATADCRSPPFELEALFYINDLLSKSHLDFFLYITWTSPSPLKSQKYTNLLASPALFNTRESVW